MIVDFKTLQKDWHPGLIGAAWRRPLPQLGAEGEKVQAALLGDRFLSALQARVRDRMKNPRYAELVK